jgi:hypothetical protein
MPGLYLILQPSGARSWAVRYRHNGAPRKHTLGAYPQIDLAHARKLAARALRTVAEGRDPGREKLAARAAKADSVDRIVEEFLERHCRRNNRPGTAAETARLLHVRVLPRWRGRLLHEIGKRDVIELIDHIADDAPIAANRVLAAVRKMFNWAVARDILASSPTAGIKPPSPERSRDRILSDSELRLVWEAANTIGYPALDSNRSTPRRGRGDGMERDQLGGTNLDAAARAGEERSDARRAAVRGRRCNPRGRAADRRAVRPNDNWRHARRRLCQGQATA